MRESAKHIVQDSSEGKLSTLEALANDIDSLDKKLTYGMLLVGGVEVIFNPLDDSKVPSYSCFRVTL